MQQTPFYFLRSLRKFIVRRISMLLIAFMLGMSNVIQAETRMVNDTRVKLEQREIVPDDEQFDIFVYGQTF